MCERGGWDIREKERPSPTLPTMNVIETYHTPPPAVYFHNSQRVEIYESVSFEIWSVQVSSQFQASNAETKTVAALKNIEIKKKHLITFGNELKHKLNKKQQLQPSSKIKQWKTNKKKKGVKRTEYWWFKFEWSYCEIKLEQLNGKLNFDFVLFEA